MVEFLSALADGDGLRWGLVVTSFSFGLRHGVDWDHIAAITDITSSQDSPRRSLLLASLYALGHGAVVLVFGTLAIVGGDLLPASVDTAMERVVGVTLVLLGAYVFYALARHGRDFRMRSRWMLLFSAVSRGWRRLREKASRPVVVIEHEHEHEHGVHHEHDHAVDVAEHRPADPGAEGLGGARRAVTTTRGHRHPHRHRGSLPSDPFTNYSRRTSFLVGMLHGVGAETPTQILVFLAAARVGGALAGALLLVVFVAGVLVSNTAISVLSATGYLSASRRFTVYATVAVVTGVFSLAIGTALLLGKGGSLPVFFGG